MSSGGRATIHRIIAAFDGALRGLDVHTDPLDVERWSVLVHEAMANRARFFHGSEHIFDVVKGTDDRADPIETLAILFHDVVYVQVDGALDDRLLESLNGAIRTEAGGGYRVGRCGALDEPVVHQVAQVFGLSEGEELSPFEGLNEFASALVAARQLGALLPLSSVVAMAACIEATIPFRGPDERGRGPYDRLAERLRRLDGRPLDEAGVVAAVTRAVRVANSDVGNFGDADPATFLDHTWNLLPESNPALQMPTAYSVRQYRVALSKMEAFLGGLSGDRVFHRWGGVPGDGVYAGLVKRANHNLAIAVRYLRVKLYASVILEALAMASGGDAPLELFVGAIPRPGLQVARVDQHLPMRAASPRADEGDEGGVTQADADPALLALFVDGRAHDASFDLRASPLSAFVYRRLGEGGIEVALPAMYDFSAERLSAGEFFRRQSPSARRTIGVIAEAASQVAVTRSVRLRELSRLMNA